MSMMMLAAEKIDVCWEKRRRLIDFIYFLDYTSTMPVTKTAKRALRGSARKSDLNKLIVSKLEIAIRVAKKSHTEKNIAKATSLADRAAKKHTIHKNKAARIKTTLSKLLPKKESPKAKTAKK
jgi:small subunit ribosomal protein S20